MKWSDYSFENLENRLKEKPYVILPVGTIEPHGPHLPLKTDAYIAEKLAEKVASKLNLLIGPTLIGDSPAKDFIGSISYDKTAKTIFRKACEQMIGYIKKLYIVNGCGGNSEAIGYICKRFPKKIVAMPTWWSMQEVRALDESRADFIKNGGEAEDWCGTHAGEIETSLMLALDESLVDKEKIKYAYGPQSKKYFNQKLTIEKVPLPEIIPNAVVGDARKSSKEKGEKMLDIIVNKYVSIIQAEIKTFK